MFYAILYLNLNKHEVSKILMRQKAGDTPLDYYARLDYLNLRFFIS